jgi:hypothetical protein
LAYRRRAIFSDFSLTAKQIAESLLAILAFLPATVSTGYVAAWATNLHRFRQRSLVERLFWSVPLSAAISTISGILIGKFISLNAFVILLWASAAICVFTLAKERLDLRRTELKWKMGWKPLGGVAFLLAIVWVLVVALSLVDWQRDHKLYMSLVVFDHGMRVDWTESVLHTGVPPANPLYMDQHPAPMRYYYFWYVLCAAVARMSYLPARAVFNASCVWSGFFLAALTGLYLKHFLGAGARLRPQFLRAISLLAVTGLGVCVNLWNYFHFHIPLPGYLEVWSAGQISSWLDSLLWDPHHVASCVCCMFGFLLAWKSEEGTQRAKAFSAVFIAAAFASAFGLSIYVAFAFFLVMLGWAIWQVASEHKAQPVWLLATGGVGAAVLLIPYLHELSHSTSNVQGSGSVFSFAVREMIPPDGLLASDLFRSLASIHPSLARSLANSVLLAPGYAAELGFFCVVFFIYLIPAWRSRKPLSPAQRSLICISITTLIVITFVRSSVIQNNDFGWRGALLLQFPLLLLASEVISTWNYSDRKQTTPALIDGLPGPTPQFVRAVASFALIFGVMTTIYQALMIRFMIPVHEMRLRAGNDPKAADLAHKTYISDVGYEHLNALIPHDAVVQYNPWSPDPFWTSMDWRDIAHQSAIAFDKPACGSELGGDPSGCTIMAAAIDALYTDATAEQARSTCHQLGIQYLIARIYDPAWKSKDSWVWTLKPVVADEEFRALNCRQ